MTAPRPPHGVDAASGAGSAGAAGAAASGEHDARARVAAQLATRAGLEVPDWVLDARIRERIAALGPLLPAGADPGHAYADLVASPGGTAELDCLIESVRVGETRFFRHRAHVRALANEVVPALHGSVPPGQPIRAWSAGCATGEEAYTLAMIIGRLLPGREVQVLATDLSPGALATARAGIYSTGALASVPERWRRYGFVAAPQAGPDAWRVAPEVSRRVLFQQHNLLARDYPGDLDLIWCRNVLIYLAPEARQQVMARLIRSLRPGGYLFVGYAESLRDAAGLEPVRTVEAVLYRKRMPDQAQGQAPTRGLSAIRSQRSLEDHAARPDSAAGADAGNIPVVRLRGRYEDERRLAAELRAVMASDHARVVLDLDGASFLADATAAVLRRAQSAARAAGVTVHLRADRAGTRRWLRRHGLDADAPMSAPMPPPMSPTVPAPMPPAAPMPADAPAGARPASARKL